MKQYVTVDQAIAILPENVYNPISVKVKETVGRLDSELMAYYSQICYELHIDPDAVIRQQQEIHRLASELERVKKELDSYKVNHGLKAGDEIYSIGFGEVQKTVAEQIGIDENGDLFVITRLYPGSHCSKILKTGEFWTTRRGAENERRRENEADTF